MNIEQKVLQYCKQEKLFDVKADVCVCVSGGADSVFLLYFLVKNKAKLGINRIVAVHVNHNLRGKESERDQVFVENFCKELGVECRVKSVQVKKHGAEQKQGIEESARELRYMAFKEVCKEEHLQVCCLAHHENDQAETVLMHILRGSGLSGACGMASKNGMYVRPLLCVKKEEILQELQNLNLSYCLDSTNQDNTYSRNYIRNVALPTLEKVYGSAISMIASFAENCKKDEAYIQENLGEDFLLVKENEIKIKAQAFNLQPSLKMRLFKKAFAKVGAYKDIEQKHLLMIDEMCKMKNGSKQNFPMNVIAFKDYDGITLSMEMSSESVKRIEFSVPQTFEKNGTQFVVNFASEVNFKDGVHFADYMKIPRDAVWRTKQPGDIFCKLGGGSKKLVDYFTDKKVVQRDRNKILLLCHKNQVLLIENMDISENVKIDSTTDKIVKIEYRR